MILDRVFKVIDVSATYIVKMTLTIDLFDFICKMKSFGMVIWLNFRLQANMLYVFLFIQLVTNFVVSCFLCLNLKM
jgi:hypothetical protein